MYYPIDDIDGLSERLCVALERAGVRTTRDLLERCARASDRQALARVIGADPAEIERAVELADLLRVKGVARRYAALLHAAGVRSVPTLRGQSPEALHAAVREAKAGMKTPYRMPTLDNIRNWIADAGDLQIVVK